MIKVGDELLLVDNTEVHGRPLSELGQFILGRWIFILRAIPLRYHLHVSCLGRCVPD